MKSILIAIITLFIISSCGEDKKKKSDQKKETKVVQQAAASKEGSYTNVASGAVVNVAIRTDDRMKFDLNKIVVKAGQKVKLTLTHAGRLGKRIMGHNVVFLKKGTNVRRFASKAAGSKGNDFIPVGATSVIAHTKMIGGGETTTIEFTAPEVGVYDYICSFPAHYALMKGKLVVVE